MIADARSTNLPRRLPWGRVAVLLLLNTLLLAGVAAALVWWPLWAHYHVATEALAPSVIESHRHQPADTALTTVAEASMMTDHPLRGEAAVAAARRILQGELVLPNLPPLPITRDFAERDLELGVPVQQVYMASLIVPDLLLRGYEHTPDPAFLAAARRYLRGFIAFEAGQSFPSGLLRNAHAVANRAAILARFWKFVRADADDATAREVHLHAQRLAALLAKPSLFIAGSNHGVMQNLALLQLAAAFPALPGMPSARELALQRLHRQWPFYLGPEGAVLEHAAGYHFHGVVVTGFIVQVLRAAGEPVPAELEAAHRAALGFLAELERPDRTMPLLGNTYRYRWSLPPLLGIDEAHWERQLRERASFAHLFPVSGYAVWWDRESAAGVPVHSVVPWGYFAEHGHRRAQEMSLMVWADGVDWSSNTGYWPGSDPQGVALSNGWDGGNGPHVPGEPGDERRRTVLRAQVAQAGLRLLDLERSVDGGLRLRRQILQWQGSTWLVLDSHEDPTGRPLRVLWTAAPETEQREIGPRRFVFSQPGKAVAMMLAVDGSEGIGAAPLRGSRAPFGGWMAFDRRVVAAPAVDARLAAPGGWMLATLALAPAAGAPPEPATMTRYRGPQDWDIDLPRPDGRVTLKRRGDELLLGRDGTDERIVLQPGAEVAGELARIEQAGRTLRADFPRVRTLEPERQRATLLLVGWWFVLVAVLLVALRRPAWPQRPLWLGANVVWLAAALWIGLVHLRP